MKFKTVILILFLLLAPSKAFAHAVLTDSYPRVESHVEELPKTVWIEFDGNLQTFDGYQVNKLMVTDLNGNRLDDGNYKVGGARVAVNIVKPASGNVIFSYRVVSEDGHPVEGKFTVHVAAIAATPEASPSVASRSDSSNVSKAVQISPTSTHPSHKKVGSASNDSKVIETHHVGFFEHHAVHISEALVALFLILGWAFYRKYS
jgi:methionine-rich copper-binding protein CopC